MFAALAFTPPAAGLPLLRWRCLSPAPAQRPMTAPAPSPGDPAEASTLAALVQRAAGGDGGAFEAFYDATFARARALARRLLPGAEVEDLLADAYFESWRQAAQFDAARGSAVAWLLTRVRSRALDLLRHRAAYPSVAGDERLAPEPAAAEADDPAERLWRTQAGSRLAAALQRLSAPERWVLGLAYFREMTQAEIAVCTGLPLGTVKSHLQRAQGKLRTLLAAGTSR